jgi:hypothetical protein
MDRDRLVKLLGMTGSTHAGEAGNAAQMAGKLLKEHNLTWDDVIVRVVQKEPPRSKSRARYERAPPKAFNEAARIVFETCADLTAVERKFIKEMVGIRAPTQKQLNWLAAICRKYGYMK